MPQLRRTYRGRLGEEGKRFRPDWLQFAAHNPAARLFVQLQADCLSVSCSTRLTHPRNAAMLTHAPPACVTDCPDGHQCLQLCCDSLLPRFVKHTPRPPAEALRVRVHAQLLPAARAAAAAREQGEAAAAAGRRIQIQKRRSQN